MPDNSKKIQDLLEVVKHKIDMLGASQTGQSGQLSMIKDQISMMNSKLDSHTGSLMSIESTLEGYADAYKVNKKNIERLDERLITVEDQLEIQPSDQLAIQR